MQELTLSCWLFCRSWPAWAHAGSHRAPAEDVRPASCREAAAGRDRGKCGLECAL